MRNLSLGRRHLVNAYEVEAGIGVIAGNTVWSMPERLECEVLQKARYKNTLTFTFFTFQWKKAKVPEPASDRWSPPAKQSVRRQQQTSWTRRLDVVTAERVDDRREPRSTASQQHNEHRMKASSTLKEKFLSR